MIKICLCLDRIISPLASIIIDIIISLGGGGVVMYFLVQF